VEVPIEPTATSDAEVPIEPTTEGQVEAQPTTEPKAEIPTTESAAVEPTTKSEDKSDSSPSSPDDVEDKPTVTKAPSPSQTDVALPQKTDEAKEAADQAYKSMSEYTKNPTKENAEKAKDDTDGALALLGLLGAGTPGFGALTDSLGKAAGVLTGAISTPGAATAAAVSSAASQVKNDLDETKKDDEKDEDEQSTKEEEEKSTQVSSAEKTTEEVSTTARETSTAAETTTAEVSTTTEIASSTETTETATTTGTMEPGPSVYYEYFEDSGSGDVVEELNEAQVPELGCMSVFMLPMPKCALMTGGTDASTTETATSDMSTTETSSSETTTESETQTTEDMSTTEETTTTAMTSFPSTLVTKTRDETSDTTTQDSTTDESSGLSTTDFTSFTSTGFTTTTTSEPPRDYPCVIFGGPRVEEPYCQCSTTSNDKQFVATAPLISGACAAYTTYPSPIPTTTAAPVIQAPIAEPYTETINGTVLEYPSRTYEYFRVYKSISATVTHGVGEATTLETPLPTETDANNKGSGQCHSIDDACERAYNQFEDDVVYTDYVSRYARIKSGIIVLASFGQAGCTVQWKCDDYGIGMKGRDIKDAIQYMKDNDGVNKCGTAYLSNTCQVTMNYCTNCHHDG
jgi:hypothetical protein